MMENSSAFMGITINRPIEDLMATSSLITIFSRSGNGPVTIEPGKDIYHGVLVVGPALLLRFLVGFGSLSPRIIHVSLGDIARIDTVPALRAEPGIDQQAPALQVE